MFRAVDHYVSPHEALQSALREHHYPPGRYDLIVMCNFLTTEQITATFATEIGQLANSLTPGGVLLVLGGASPKHEPIYTHLSSIVGESGSTRPVLVLDETLQAHSDLLTRAEVALQIVDDLGYVDRLALDAFDQIRGQLPRDVRDLYAAKVRFPQFKVVAYKNQWQRRRNRQRKMARSTGPRSV
jgi:hypothetical protein